MAALVQYGRKMWYVRNDGLVTDDIKLVLRKCVGVVEASSATEAEERAKELHLK